MSIGVATRLVPLYTPRKVTAALPNQGHARRTGRPVAPQDGTTADDASPTLASTAIDASGSAAPQAGFLALLTTLDIAGGAEPAATRSMAPSPTTDDGAETATMLRDLLASLATPKAA